MSSPKSQGAYSISYGALNTNFENGLFFRNSTYIATLREESSITTQNNKIIRLIVEPERAL